MFTESTYSSDPMTPVWSLEKLNTDSHESFQFSSAPHSVDNDPFDHSKLRNTWYEMLNKRWLSAQPTSVLPLYLSTIFEDYRALPALEIIMPPGGTSSTGKRPLHNDISSVSDQRIDPSSFRHLRHATVKTDPDNSSVRTGDDLSPHFLSSWAPMHLARTVQTIIGCKEAMIEAYETLYQPEQMKITDQYSLREHSDALDAETVGKEPNKNTVRDEFEDAWFNWER